MNGNFPVQSAADFVILFLFVGCRILIYFLRLSGAMHSLSHGALVKWRRHKTPSDLASLTSIIDGLRLHDGVTFTGHRKRGCSH